MKAMAGWMAALMLLTAPAAFCDELPPGVEIQRVEGVEPQQAAPQETAPQETVQEQAAPRQAPQTGDNSLLAVAGLGVSAGALALTRKGKKDSGDQDTAQ